MRAVCTSTVQGRASSQIKSLWQLCPWYIYLWYTWYIYLNIRLREAHVGCRRNNNHHLCLLMIVRYFGAISKREASSSLMSHGQRESRTARWTDYTWPPDTFGLKTVRLLVPAPVPQICLFGTTLTCVREKWHKGNGNLNCEVDGMEGHHNKARS